jgi:ferredoxin
MTNGEAASEAATAGVAGRPSDREMVTVTCLDRSGNEAARVEVPKGTVLLRALEEVGFVYGACGGFGSCGTCGVELADGRTVQSCFIRVYGDITVRKRR